MIEKVRQAHKKYFSKNPDLVVISPGRVNLIGEHTDYNNGFVMPAAINFHTAFSFTRSGTNTAHVIGLDVDDELKFSIEDTSKVDSFWGTYIKGTLAQFVNSQLKIEGFNCTFSGNIPIGAGLSSSASLTCGLAFGLNELFNLSLSKWELAKMAQMAEHQYAKVYCGIMDQFANLFSHEKKISMLDCKSLDFNQETLDSEDFEILLIDTGVKHELASTEYNIRKQQCELATSVIQQSFPEVQSLRDANESMLEACKNDLGDTLFTKASYVVQENERVLKGFDDLQNNRIEEFGEKMIASHAGLRDQYMVSCEELDFLVDGVLETTQALGARMMGGGFGGCTINLIRQGAGNELKTRISSKFQDRFSIDPKFYSIQLTAGTYAT